MRTLRELLGLSQDRLARLAGVSQGAISRFEKGTAVGTPALVMFKLAVALARQCRAENKELLAEPLIRVLDDIEQLVPVRTARGLPTMARDPQVAQLLILFRAAPPRAREALLSIVRAFCTVAGSEPEE
jgi:transcriptional regulator with XRE-family HTH domain